MKSRQFEQDTTQKREKNDNDLTMCYTQQDCAGKCNCIQSIILRRVNEERAKGNSNPFSIKLTSLGRQHTQRRKKVCNVKTSIQDTGVIVSGEELQASLRGSNIYLTLINNDHKPIGYRDQQIEAGENALPLQYKQIHKQLFDQHAVLAINVRYY